ncbi:MAG: hypothetical protein Q9222_004318 [Ikaeria aurantiellina]
MAAANPLPKNAEKEITPAEWAALRSAGLVERSPKNAPKPITPAETQALKDAGLGRRNYEASIEAREALEARDKTVTCGHLVTGIGGNEGHGVWIPVQDFADQADEFCNAYVGTDVPIGHEVSDEYSISLTNQNDNTKAGNPGNLVLAIYNQARSPSYVVNHDECLRAMQAPLGDHKEEPEKPRDELRKRRTDNCWGPKNDDYMGGYYYLNGIGSFGSEVYKA